MCNLLSVHEHPLTYVQAPTFSWHSGFHLAINSMSDFMVLAAYLDIPVSRLRSCLDACRFAAVFYKAGLPLAIIAPDCNMVSNLSSSSKPYLLQVCQLVSKQAPEHSGRTTCQRAIANSAMQEQVYHTLT